MKRESILGGPPFESFCDHYGLFASSFGSPANMSCRGSARSPVALRPGLSTSLPFSKGVRVKPASSAARRGPCESQMPKSVTYSFGLTLLNHLKTD